MRQFSTFEYRRLIENKVFVATKKEVNETNLNDFVRKFEGLILGYTYISFETFGVYLKRYRGSYVAYARRISMHSRRARERIHGERDGEM